MLLWELLNTPEKVAEPVHANGRAVTLRCRRLPYDRRCMATTKTGGRCRARVREGHEFCTFHDPEFAARRRNASVNDAARRKRRRLSHLPDGYLRKLSSTAAVGEAMDRLYREVRLGIITVEMGEVLFNVLTRLLDAGLVPLGPRPERTRAARVRPKLSELLTRSEKRAWRRAVDNACATPLSDHKSARTFAAAS